MIPPATRFCFCFPLSTGVKIIAWIHLFVNSYTCAMAMGSVLLNLPTYSYGTSTGTQIFDAIWSLAGIPIVLLGLWGASHRMEPHVRIYLYYLVVSVIIDTCYLAELFLLRDSCVRLQLDSQLNEGRAFACGVARGMSMTAFGLATAAVAYMCYIVYSFCEDLVGGGISDVIADLLAHAETEKYTYHQAHQNADYAAIERSMARMPPGKNGNIARLAAYMA